MNSIVRTWRNWNNGRKFEKKGKNCRILGSQLTIDGHVELGDYCRIREDAIMRTHGNGKIIFGHHSGCSFHCVFEAQELIQIGNETGIAEFCVLRDTNHLFHGTDAHWAYTPHITKPIIIGNNCFIGSRTYIQPGVTIEDGAIIGIGSMLLEDTHVGPLEIWAGTPARKICHRTEGLPPERIARAQALIEEQGLRKSRYKNKFE